jgi:hypothetical protein
MPVASPDESTLETASPGPAVGTPTAAPGDRLAPGSAMIIGLLMVSTFVVLLNEMMLGVALPTLISDLDITPTTGQWLTTGYLLNLVLDPNQLDEPLTAQQLAVAAPSPFDPRSPRALEVAHEGWTLRDILAHGVIDYHPTPVGEASVTADHMQEWFDAGACDGFWVSIDVNEDGIDTFVDEVVPLLQERGIYHHDYDGATLRDHLGAPAQYGLDPRLTEPTP